VDEGGRMHMPAGKFSAIIRKVTEHLAFDPAGRLTFEVSDGIAPMSLYSASSPRFVGEAIHVALWPRPASCKPRDRWLESSNRTCCVSAAEQPCCR
jgi:hypothetical protein